MPDDWKVGLIVPLFKKGKYIRVEEYMVPNMKTENGKVGPTEN